MTTQDTAALIESVNNVAQEVSGKMSAIDAKVAQADAAFRAKAESLVVSSTMGYRNAVERISGGKRTLITDAFSNLEEMCVIGRRNYEDLDLPELNLGTGIMTAFLTNGAPRSEVFISPYQSTSVAGKLAGVGGQYPTGSLNFDQMKAMYKAKGAGWHMISMHEWELLRLISLKFNPDIAGNTYYGRSHARRYESATRQDGKAPGDTSSYGYTRAGAGPSSWSHDGTDYGVFDLVGNKWEWVDQFKLLEGEIICTPDNQPDLDESLWTRQGIYYDNATGVPKLSTVVTSRSDGSQYSHSGLNSNVTKDASYTGNELMRRLGVEHAAPSSEGGIWVRNVGERFPIRGGGSSYAGGAGPSAVDVNNPRSYAHSEIVSRSAFFAN